MPRKLRLLLEYDGTAYEGWQLQARSDRTIQFELERAIETVTGTHSRIQVAGRTDSGVHALGQVAHFVTDSRHELERFTPALNWHLPKDISVVETREVPMEFDARFDARGKIYRYTILNRAVRSGILRDRAWQLRKRLDIEAMQAAANHLLGEHDFSSFRSHGCSSRHPVRHIYKLDVTRHQESYGPEIVDIEIFATAYLKQMVRNISGTLALVGRGLLNPDDMLRILEARDRKAAGPAAPACGLKLVKIFYEDDPPPPELMDLIPDHHFIKAGKPKRNRTSIPEITADDGDE